MIGEERCLQFIALWTGVVTVFPPQLKHTTINAMSRNEYLTAALENLTPDDVRHLLISEDELNRAVKWVAALTVYTSVFKNSYYYKPFFLDKKFSG